MKKTSSGKDKNRDHNDLEKIPEVTNSNSGKKVLKKKGPRIDHVFKVLGLTALMLIILLSPEIKKTYSDYVWKTSKKSCYENQKKIIELVATYNKSNIESPVGRGEIQKNGPLKELEKFQCPSKGILRLEAVDLGSEMTVSCSIHGSRDRQADMNGKIEFPVMAGTFIYDAKVGREKADLVASFLIGTGFFNTPKARIDLSLVDSVYIISFKVNKVIKKGDEFYEKAQFYSKQISYECLDGSPVEFALYPPGGVGIVKVRAKIDSSILETK